LKKLLGFGIIQSPKGTKTFFGGNIMKKTFNFGKIDYMDRGRKDCAVDVTIWLEEKGGEKVLDKPEKDLEEIKNLFAK
jgi:hypothetical protein